MSYKVIYSACSIPFWVDIAKELYNQLNWIPCYWIGRNTVESYVRQHFNSVAFHEQNMAITCKIPVECKEINLPPIDEHLLNNLASHESIVFHMMDRYDPDATETFQFRKQQYLKHLKYWYAVINHFKPDILFNVSTPHQVYDYILYILCQQLGIKTILLGISFDVPFMLFPKGSIEDGSGRIGPIYNDRLKSKKWRDIRLSNELESRITKIQNKNSPAYLDKLNIKSSKFVFLKSILYGSYLSVNNLLSDDVIKGYKEKNAKNPFKYNRYTNLRWVQKLKKYYDAIATDIDFDKPYIYVALHYQPELSTCPEGGVFVNQLLLVELLSRCIPDTWHLYIKEHPVQFTNLGYNRCVRSVQFYKNILALPNARLLPLKTSSFNLIDHSIAVATVTGMVAWESVIRGKPALHFGHAWFQGCEGTFYTPDVESIKQALEKIRKGYSIDINKVRLFLKVMEEESCYGEIYTDTEQQKLTAKDSRKIAKQVNQLSETIQKFFDSTTLHT